jgi:hypothetical protein
MSSLSRFPLLHNPPVFLERVVLLILRFGAFVIPKLKKGLRNSITSVLTCLPNLPSLASIFPHPVLESFPQSIAVGAVGERPSHLFNRFGAIAYLNKPVQEPLTDFLNVLPFDESGSFERLAKVFGAVREWLPLQAQQLASIPQGTYQSRHKYLKMGLPYPVAFPDLCPEFQKAMPGR